MGDYWVDPQTSSDAELAILGGIMLTAGEAMDRVANLRDEHFADTRNRWLFGILRKLRDSKTPCDAVTVYEALSRRYPDRAAELTDYVLTTASNTPGSASIKAYAQILIDKYRDLQTIAIAGRLMDNPRGAEQAIRDLMALSSGAGETSHTHTIKEAVKAAWNQIEEAYNSNGALIGVTTGIDAFDEYCGGLHKGDLIVIGARPAMGKTAFLASMAQAADVSRLFVSAEQSSEQLGQRLLSMTSRIPLSDLRAGRIEESDFPMCTHAIRTLNTQSCIIHDRPSPTLDELVRVARKAKLEKDIKAIYVDYIQRIRYGTDRMSKVERVGEVVIGLKGLARELDVPVVALAQVKRDVETRANKRPSMGDLSDSSEIEKEADIIGMLYRDEVYDKNTAFPGIAELIIDKNRHGAIGTVRTRWNGPLVTFSNLA